MRVFGDIYNMNWFRAAGDRCAAAGSPGGGIAAASRSLLCNLILRLSGRLTWRAGRLRGDAGQRSGGA